MLNTKYKILLDKQITEYLLTNNKIWVNKEPVKVNLLGYEVEEEAIWFYLESEATKFENSIKVENTVLLSDHDSQQNIVHVYVEGNSPKSMLLRKDHESEILEF